MLDRLKRIFFDVVPHCFVLKAIPDKMYTEMLYYYKIGKRLNLNNPATFNEKINWLKLYDRKPIYTLMADKYTARLYVAATIGEEYLIPMAGIWDSAEDIDFSNLPAKFVLKCTHDSASVVICTDKTKMDYQTVRRALNRSLRRNYHYNQREWPYKNIKPRIIAEEYVEDAHAQLWDYRFFCFNGEVKHIQVDYERVTEYKSRLYTYKRASFTPDWEYIEDVSKKCYTVDSTDIIEKPISLDLMKNLAGRLSEGYPFIRVDLHAIGERVLFGELTFHPHGGHDPMPESLNSELGNCIKLPK